MARLPELELLQTLRGGRCAAPRLRETILRRLEVVAVDPDVARAKPGKPAVALLGPRGGLRT